MKPEDLLRDAPPLIRSVPLGSPLKKCKACGHDIARGARTCPHCGKRYTTAGGVVVAIIVGLVLAALLLR